MLHFVPLESEVAVVLLEVDGMLVVVVLLEVVVVAPVWGFLAYFLLQGAH